MTHFRDDPFFELTDFQNDLFSEMSNFLMTYSRSDRFQNDLIFEVTHFKVIGFEATHSQGDLFSKWKIFEVTFFRSDQCPKGSILEVIDLEVTQSDFFSKRPIFETKLILEVTDFEMTYYSMCPFFESTYFPKWSI